MPQKNIPVIWMFPEFPWTQMVFTNKVSIEWIVRVI